MRAGSSRKATDVSAGDLIAEIETDKATMEVEAVDEGKVGKLLVEEGAEGVEVNAIIAVLVGDGEEAPADAGKSAPALQARSPPQHAAEAAVAPQPLAAAPSAASMDAAEAKAYEEHQGANGP